MAVDTQALYELLDKVRKTVGADYAMITVGSGFKSHFSALGLDRWQAAALLRQQAALIEAGQGQFGQYQPTEVASPTQLYWTPVAQITAGGE